MEMKNYVHIISYILTLFFPTPIFSSLKTLLKLATSPREKVHSLNMFPALTCFSPLSLALHWPLFYSLCFRLVTHFTGYFWNLATKPHPTLAISPIFLFVWSPTIVSNMIPKRKRNDQICHQNSNPPIWNTVGCPFAHWHHLNDSSPLFQERGIKPMGSSI